MSDYFSSNDKYTYADSKTLKNLLEIKDSAKLEDVEKKLTFLRLSKVQELIHKSKISFKLLLEIHKTFFQDIYSWAGKIREVQLSKGKTLFAHPQFIQNQAQKTFTELENENFLIGLGKAEFCKRLAHYYNEINILHPFREGNGRVLKFITTGIINKAKFDINWSKIGNEEHLKSCIIAYQKNDLSYLERDFLKIISIKKKKNE